MAYFKEYPFITEHLHHSYDGFLNKLKDIINTTDQLFTTQIHEDYGVYDRPFREWFKENSAYQPQPFAVSRIKDGKCEEIPYHVFYEDAVKRICDLLEEAKDLINNIEDESFDKKWWSTYINVLQEGYLHDDWEKAEEYFLTSPHANPLLLSIGPIDTYHDKTAGVKKIFSAWLLVKNIAGQEQTDIVCKHLTDITQQNTVMFYIGDLLFSGGEVAKHGTMGWSRSERIELAAKYGSIKMIAFNKLPEHTLRMERAMEKSLSTWKLSKELGDAIMAFHKTNSLLPLVLHEYSHTYKKSPNAQKKLKVFYTDIEETRANTYMAYFAHILETNKQLPPHTARNIVLRVLLYLPYLYEEYSVRNQREAYYFAALYWLKKAEHFGVVTIDDTVTVRERVIEKKLEGFIDDTRESLEMLVENASQTALERQKKELFLFGADLAIKLGW